MKVAPSIIAADFSRLNQEITKVEKGLPDFLHLDIMDGVFVPNITFGPMIVEAINKLTKVKLDAHLMIVKPENYLLQYIKAGADMVSFHAEATKQTKTCIEFIKKQDKMAGLAISPATPFEKIARYVGELDFVLIMSVNPGFYGQKFIADTLQKTERAKNFIKKHRFKCLIQVDGGIYPDNARSLASAGVDIVVSGAGVFKTGNYAKAIKELRCSED